MPRMPRLLHLTITIRTTNTSTYLRDYRTNQFMRGDISRPRVTKKHRTKPREPCGTSMLENVGIPFGTFRLPPPMTRSRGARQLNLLCTNGIPFGKVRLPPAKLKQATLILIKQKMQQTRLRPHRTKITHKNATKKTKAQPN